MSRSAARRAWPAALLPLALAALLVGAALRLAELGAWSFWADEVASLNISAASMADIWRRAQDLNAPLYYLFLHGWQGLAAGEAWQRLPSALAGVLALPLVWRIGASLGDEVAGVLAMGLLAVSPLHVWYSREVRMYVLACFFAVAAFYCYVCLLRGGGVRHAAGFAVATLLAVYTAYAALLFWAALLVVFPVLARRQGTGAAQVRAFWIAQLAVALGFAGYLTVFGAQIASGNLGFLGKRLAGFMPQLGPALAGLTGAVLVAGLCVWKTHRAKGTLRASAWAPWIVILAFLALTLLAAVPRGFSVKRQLLVFWPFVVLAAAWALRRINLPGLYAGALVASLAATAALLAAGPAEDWRGAAAYIATVAQPGDTIYAQSDLAGAALAYYYRGPVPIYAPGLDGVWTAPPPAPERGATAWVVANDHPALQDEVAALSARLGIWGRPEIRAAFARFLRVIAYRTEASKSRNGALPLI